MEAARAAGAPGRSKAPGGDGARQAVSRAPFVAVRTDIRKEERVLVIADIAGYSRHEALGRLIDLWAWCADRKLDDAPDDCPGYAVSDAVVCRFLGRHGVEAILGGGDEVFALGLRRPDGLIQLLGTEDTAAQWRARDGAAPGILTYAISADSLGVVKIGKTNDIARRMRVMQTANHAELLLLGCLLGDHEEATHRDLDDASQRVRGEWFRLSPATVSVLARRGFGGLK